MIKIIENEMQSLESYEIFFYPEGNLDLSQNLITFVPFSKALFIK